MKFEKWNLLKHGDKIKHRNGDIETIYVDKYDGKKYIEGKRTLFPLTEFDHNDWELVNNK